MRSYVPGKSGVPRSDMNEQAHIDEMNQQLFNLTKTLATVSQNCEASVHAAADEEMGPYNTHELRRAANQSLQHQLVYYTAVMSQWAGATDGRSGRHQYLQPVQPNA